MAEKNRKRLLPRFTESEPIYPVDIHEVKLVVVHGPNMHLLDDCMMAPTFQEVVRRACEFVMLIPLQKKGQNQRWPKDPGQHYQIPIPLAVVGHQRLPDDKFNFMGRLVCSHGVSTPTLLEPDVIVNVRSYDFRSRFGSALVSAFDYCKFINFLVGGAFPLANRSY